MNLLRLNHLFAGLFLVASAMAQVKPVVPGPVDAFTTDEVGNIYVLRGDELELYNAQGASWLRNSFKTFGPISHLDAFYSLKPLIFSQEQGQLAMLDNTLAVQGSVLNLPRIGFPQVVLACASVQNGFWFFDQQELGLIRVDAQLRKLANTGRLDQLLGITPAPTAMQEFDSRLYVNDPSTGILVFDLFGTYMKTIPLKEVSSFEVRSGYLYFVQGGLPQVYDMRSFAIDAIPLPESLLVGLIAFRIERGRAYVLTPSGIVIHEAVDRP
ncbi:MAG TPA: hypothetical protein PLL57_08070 [Flavobacteriales bacterium]|nr:hypothetical protein [Flavobacteriales bacterium]